MRYKIKGHAIQWGGGGEKKGSTIKTNERAKQKTKKTTSTKSTTTKGDDKTLQRNAKTELSQPHYTSGALEW